MWVIHTQSETSTRSVIVTGSVISTRTKVNAECDIHTQIAISTRRVRFLQEEYNFHTKCDFETDTFVRATLTSVISIRTRVISTRRV
jgi:hypothetical protein